MRGEVSVEWSTISDFVIVRSNGTPVFFLANAVDDVDMGITHVLRGEDLLDSTHRVLALRRALGHDDQPVYAHLPLILGPGGAKLSKRHGAVSVEEYRDAGYLPHALVNYLALLGWGPEDGREVLTIDELIAEFDVSRVNAVAGDVRREEARVDERRAHSPHAARRAGRARRCRSHATRTAIDSTFAFRTRGCSSRKSARQHSCRSPNKPRSCSFRTMSSRIDEKSWEKLLTTERANEVLDAVIEFVENCEWSDRDRAAGRRSSSSG